MVKIINGEISVFPQFHFVLDGEDGFITEGKDVYSYDTLRNGFKVVLLTDVKSVNAES